MANHLRQHPAINIGKEVAIQLAEFGNTVDDVLGRNTAQRRRSRTRSIAINQRGQEFRTNGLGTAGSFNRRGQMYAVISARAALQNGLVVQAICQWRGHDFAHRLGPRRLAKDRYICWIAAKTGNIVSYPFERFDLVEQSIIA